MLGGLIYTQKQSGDWGNLGLPLRVLSRTPYTAMPSKCVVSMTAGFLSSLKQLLQKNQL